MIVTVTMNPAIDKTVQIEKLVPGGLNRISGIEYDAGGKGINVSKTIAKLGGSSVATGFLGGSTGRQMEEMLREESFDCDFVWVNGETRTNTKVCDRDGTITELNEPGPKVSEEKLRELLEKLRSYAEPETVFVLSGSIPAGVPKMIYADLVRMAHEAGAGVLLDADGDLFRYGVAAGPDIVKPNIEELNRFMQETEGYEDIQKIEQMAISMGGDGAVFLLGEEQYFCPALPVAVRSTVGAGDAMVAALAYAFTEHLTSEETIRLCMAISAGAVTTVGTKPPELSLIQELERKVQILPFSEMKQIPDTLRRLVEDKK